MKFILGIYSLLVFSTTVMAESSYDYSSGNSYYTNSYGSKTTTNGYNSNTGSSWNSTYDKSTGRASGTDAKGNYWNYDSRSGNYYNTSGKTCYGKGQYRVCN